MKLLLKGGLRDRDLPASNRVRYIRWKLKKFWLKNHPGAHFPLEIYYPGD